MARLSNTPSWLTRHLKPSGQLPAIQFIVAAIGSAQGAAALAVQPWEFLHGCRQAFLQVDQGLAAPVAADRVRELLAIAGRTVEVDKDGGVARACIHLRIPAVAPA